MKILVLDNYDSFTYNLVHYLEELTDAQVDVYRNDEISVEEAAAYDKIVLSPGPGIPDEAGILKPLIKALAPTHSILGVCLGCQAIAEVFGGQIYNLSKVYHGIATPIRVEDPDEILFNGLPTTFEAGRYHSWVVDEQKLPESLKITARDEEGQIMGLRHSSYDVRAVQFHPESILTQNGKEMIKNWLQQ
ncbi:MAG TPA: aminodeoxychorismate/anthranilate synthase component II [Bacteroidales bacterium]|jgi:anthranilate synthase component 2|nr:aminodeoxychorismate/anthranilate synthase component II [Bacteroidales bacterium]